ncbi:MAG: YfjI family protein [Candidatus Omnitrophica bacterium]|nr:YfjI family protein [Candidatus Omnitrophota bacterium]
MSFLNDYIDYAGEFCDAPSIFHKYSALSVVSSVIGRKVFIRKGDIKFFPNLWILLISPSSIFHRSTAIRISRNLLSKLSNVNIYANDFSREGFIKMVQDQPEGFFTIDEFGGFLKVLEREYMLGLKELITELFEAPDYYKRKLSGETIELKNVCFNILAGSNLRWLQNSLKESDVQGGFIPRFLIIYAKTKENIIPFQPPSSLSKQSALLEELSNISRIQGEVDFSGVVKEYSEWYISYQKEFSSEHFDAFCIRLLDYCLKIAILFEIIENHSLVITLSSLYKAILEIENITESLLSISDELFEVKGFHNQKKKVLSIIQKFPEGISKSSLLQRININAKELQIVIETLLQSELIKIERVKTGTKPILLLKPF